MKSRTTPLQKSCFKALLATIALWLTGQASYATSDIPDVRLRVTVQQNEQGKINPAFHLQDLECIQGECTLISITLNSCRYFPITRAPASPVVIERTSTTTGALRVTRDGNTLVLIERGSDIGGEYVTTQRFQYEQPVSGAPIRRLIGYSGGLVKNSSIARQVIAIQYVPLRSIYEEVQLDCPTALPGLDSPQ